jgi:hypothetical protein
LIRAGGSAAGFVAFFFDGFDVLDSARRVFIEQLPRANLSSQGSNKPGWNNDPHSIAEQRTITDGRIVPVGNRFIRRPSKRADYLLRYTRDFALAVVEAKAGYLHTHPDEHLFFDRSGPTREVWYYEQPLPEGRKNYTKTAPIQFEEFAGVISWLEQPRRKRTRVESVRRRVARERLQPGSQKPARPGRHHP